MNRVLFFLISSILAIILGWGIGSYITYNNTIEAIGKIPGSPIVVNAEYDKKNHRVVFSVLNPGTVPIYIKAQSLVFKPGKQTKQEAYAIQNIPVDIPLVPMGLTSVNINLKKGTPALQIGDVVMITLHYVHPLSKDIYSVVHSFEFSKNKNQDQKQKENK
jgi:hypothetical protein